MSLKCIVNAAENWGIGREDQLLVSISQDLKRFRALTTGKTGYVASDYMARS